MLEPKYALSGQGSEDPARGLLITIEGPDGAGKSTQLEKIRQYFEENDIPVVFMREPGGTVIGEKLRDIILDPELSEMTAMTEALLYAAARAQIVEEKILPNLKAGKTVVCDRYVDSSIAYQAYGRGLGSVVKDINQYAVDKASPDLTILLMLSPEQGMNRIGEDTRDKDRIELASMDFHQKVLEGYKAVARDHPDRVFQLDASLPIDEIASRIRAKLDQYFCK